MTIPLVRLSDVVKQCEILFDPDVLSTVIDKDKEMVELDSLFGHPPPQSTSSSFVARLILNKSFMKFRHITVVMIRTLLGKRLSSKAHVISSEDNSLEWVVRIRYKRMKEVVSSFDDPGQEDFVCHRITTALMDTVAISGHLQISSASVREEEDQFIVDTLGCNLVDLSAMDCVDWTKCYTNDVNEAHSVLGLEAAVSVLFNELETTISYDGTYVDPRHLMMIVNTMTRGGYIMPLSRHGINRIDTGPLLRCSFEETPDILCDAACFAESDNGNGISQNIMTGKLPSIGSGLPLVASSVDHLHPRCLLEKDSPSSCIECSDDIYPIFSDSSDDPFSSSMMMMPDSDTDLAPPQSDYFPPPVQEYRPSSPCMMD
jgi:DNA-directed RNA polymerase II subunit RPB1